MKKVLVAMSGGVDSSVAAKLLIDQGYKVSGVFLNFWKDDTLSHGHIQNKCCSYEARMDARMVCHKLGIPFYEMDFQSVFKKEVVDYFLSEYEKGRTPNPCVVCNKAVKIGLLIEKARDLGFDLVATGHYAQVKTKKQKNKEAKKQSIEYELHKGIDSAKDQSYFLYKLNQRQLKHLLFPLGGYTKTQVRKIAEKTGLPVAAKKESQEICFIPGKSHRTFLQKYLKLKEGPIKILGADPPEVIGRHAGLPLYTLGQRKGIEIGGGEPYYVAEMDFETGTLYVVKSKDCLNLYKSTAIVQDINWLSGRKPKMPLSAEAVIRYKSLPINCRIDDEKSGDHLTIRFKKAAKTVTPGQSIVFYQKSKMLGGGIISKGI